ncbi:HlyD family secretion protein [Paucibacter sp. KBW04]|uniref:HlyD family secretion protein n=1 Tax=Paucibacter sp. KBW04 TaxID=2153361 RepID=UPI0018CC4053|nr:HlyD family efflux transporter periplasmic adaptor subunit [Paucibacter sp. KBW04]
MQTEERQTQQDLETYAVRVALASKSHERFAELDKSGFVSATQTQQKREELLDLQLRERGAQRNLQALQRDIQSVQAELVSAQTATQTSLAQLDRARASLEQEATEDQARAGLSIRAPQAGQVSALTLSPGQAVQAGQTVISLLPVSSNSADLASTAPLEAHLFAPSRTAGFVRPGQVVWLRYAAFPYQKFGMARGQVVSVSHTPINPQDLPAGQGQALLAAAQSNEPLYRINVSLGQQTITTYGQATALKAGMALEADVQQERRRVWEWMMEPVLATYAKNVQ